MASDGTDDTVDRGGDVGAVDDESRRVDGDESTDAPDPSPFVWEAELDDDTNDGDERTEPTPSDSAWAADPSPRRTLDPDPYLFAGETARERVDVGRGWVVATSHRLLVFDPDSSGKRFVTVDRPNVVDVGMRGRGHTQVRSYALRAGLYAAVLLVGGLAARSLGVQSLFAASPDVGNTPGVGGLVSLLSLVGTLVGLLVDLLFFGGLALALVALGLGGWYLRGRQPTLVVERAGEDDIELELPSHAVGRRAVEGLERALAEELGVRD